MALYARPSWRLARQITADLFMLAWIIGWGLVARFTHGVVAALATPAAKTAEQVREVSTDVSTAADKVSQVPAVGDDLRAPFDAVVEGLGSIATSADEQVQAINQAALVTGWLVFLLPVAVLVAIWLPRRIRFVQTSTAAQRFIDADADLDLFALRAMATQPMAALAEISDDPVAAWRAGDRDVIDALAELELRRSGLRPPAPARATSCASPGERPPGTTPTRRRRQVTGPAQRRRGL